MKRERDGTVDLIEALKPVLTPNPALDLSIIVERGNLRFQSAEIDAPFAADRADIVLRFPLGMKPFEFDLALADSKQAERGTLKLVGWIDAGSLGPIFNSTSRIANGETMRRPLGCRSKPKAFVA